MNYSLVLFFGMFIFLVGFMLGRKVGLEEGEKTGLKKAPLEIKCRSLEMGECIICGITKNFQDYAGKL
ncbi:MAG: hypothetical protein KAX49_05070 [Halanaerobiales bacterium]|nr:hypothetical protein [Halanaerobiales bacterium]